MTYSAALIGCGKIGSLFADDPLMKGDVFSHAEAYDVCPETELIAVMDTDKAALTRCGERWNVAKRYSSVVTLMDEAKPDIVSVATPTPSHYSVLVQLLHNENRPRAILAEKPLASTLIQAERVVQLAKQQGVLLVVMHMRRYADNMRNLRDFIRSGGIGELRNDRRGQDGHDHDDDQDFDQRETGLAVTSKHRGCLTNSTTWFDRREPLDSTASQDDCPVEIRKFF